VTVLVAGLGNMFCSDDAFGVAVVAELSQHSLPDGVEVRDFGIRGIHLAYQLLEPYDLVVLVDTVERGGPPGTVYLIEAEPGAEPGPEVSMDAHDLGPDAVLSLVPRLGGTVGPVVVVGCEPAAADRPIPASTAAGSQPTTTTGPTLPPSRGTSESTASGPRS